MDPGAPAPREPESTSPPSPSPTSSDHPPPPPPPAPPEPSSSSQQQQQHPSRYESQKRRDWNTFLQYLKNHKPPLTLARCSGAHVIEFLKYLDQFGKTKVHNQGCPYFGQPNPPEPCTCPLKQAWGSLDALIGRLRAAYEENGGKPESNPFGARAVRIYLREVRESQAKARGIPYEKKKRKRTTTTTAGASSATAGEDQTSSSSASKVAATTTSEGAKNGDGHGDQGDGSGVGTTSDTKLTQTASASASASATVNRDSSPTPPAS